MSEVITLVIDGEPLPIVVEYEQLDGIATYPARRKVYLVTWQNDVQIDGPTAAARPGRWPRPPAT